MYIFSIIGACTISLSAMVYFKEINAYKRRGVKQSEAFIELIEYIKNQVECFLLPVDKILEACDKGLLSRCGFNADSRSPLSISEIIDCSDLYVDTEVAELMKKFANEFGSVYKDEQIRLCNHCISELRCYVNKAQAKYTNDRKMYLGLSVCFAVSLILMLI